MVKRRSVFAALRHLLFGRAVVGRIVPPSAMEAIRSAVTESERGHSGDIVVAVEGGLDITDLIRGVSPRERAEQVFSDLRVWDTEANNGVLIYLLLADRSVEILADRGIARAVSDDRWERICSDMEECLRDGRIGDGLVTAVRRAAEVLREVFPAERTEGGELDDSVRLV